MSYAIIETGGKQLRVEPGRFYDVDRLPVEEGEKVSIEKVFLVQHEGDIHIGQPLVEGATVQGTVLRHLRGKKVIVYKMKPKKKTRKKRGHRQELTRLAIESIGLNGTLLAAAETETAATAEVVETEATGVVETEAPETTPTEVEATGVVETEAPETTPTEVEATGVAETEQPEATPEEDVAQQ